MVQNTKRVLTVHDLSGFGHTSLMAAIAILYRMGMRVAALPTALLSANTDFEGYSFESNDTGMERFVRHWTKLGMSFDAVYTGFLGGPEQVKKLVPAIHALAKEGALVLVDPVLGDHGKLYGCYDPGMTKAMRELVKHAGLITPNATEAALLLDEEADVKPEMDWRGMAIRLSGLGPEQVVITSIPSSDPVQKYCGAYDSRAQQWEMIPYRIREGAHPGSGDCFASFLLSGMLNGHGFLASTRAAMNILSMAIGLELPGRTDWREGIMLERILSLDLEGYYVEEAEK